MKTRCLEPIMTSLTTYAAGHGVEALFAPYKGPLGDLWGIELTDLFANTTGQGDGTKVMLRLAAVADATRTVFFVRPSCERSKAFYTRFGFRRKHRTCEMVRHLLERDED